MKTRNWIIIVVALIVAIIILNMKNISLQKKYERYYQNYNVLKYEYSNLRKMYSDREIYITQKDLFDMYSNLLVKIKEYGVKGQHVEHLINYSYRIKDTTLSIIHHDTITREMNFIVNKDCYNIKGKIKNDTILVNTTINDTFDVVLYKKKNKDISWIKRLFNSKLRYTNNVLIYSHCKNDTIKSNYNIKIVK